MHFGRDVTLRGTVISMLHKLNILQTAHLRVLVLANDGQKIVIPDGCVFENRELSYLPVIMNGFINVLRFRIALRKLKHDGRSARDQRFDDVLT